MLLLTYGTSFSQQKKQYSYCLGSLSKDELELRSHSKVMQVRLFYKYCPDVLKYQGYDPSKTLCFVANDHGYIFSSEPEGDKFYLYKETERDIFDSLFIVEGKLNTYVKQLPDGYSTCAWDCDEYFTYSNGGLYPSCVKVLSNGWILVTNAHQIDRNPDTQYPVFYLLKPNKSAFGFEFYQFDGKNMYYPKQLYYYYARSVSDIDENGQCVIQMTYKQKQIILQFEKDGSAKFIE